MNDPEEIRVDTVPPPTEFYKSVQHVREQGARWVSRAIVIIFGLATLVALLGGLVIIWVHPPAIAGSDAKSNLISDAVLPLLQGVSTFASTIFGPLLAFVLGYYFGEKAEAKAS
jgi:hypothetical protein